MSTDGESLEKRTGAAGQGVNRRAILRRGTIGFIILQVGAQLGSMQKVKPGHLCNPAVPDSLCGSENDDQPGDQSCNQKQTYEGSGVFPADLDCAIQPPPGPATTQGDQNCSFPASGTSYHGDEGCSSSDGPDTSCGLASAEGTITDHDCANMSGMTAEGNSGPDNDCGLSHIGGGTHTDNYTKGGAPS